MAKGLQKGLSFIGLMPSAEEKDLIKRVIAVGGDTVECKGTGPVMVNGKALNEPYVFAGQHPVHAPIGPSRSRSQGPDLGDGRPPPGLAGLPLPPCTARRRHSVRRAGRRPRHRGRLADQPLVHAADSRTFDQPGINAAGAAVPAAAGLVGRAPAGAAGAARRLLQGASAGHGLSATGSDR